jgi:hypothetical protein
MASRQWLEVRRHWHAKWVRRNGCEPICVVCGGDWTLAGGDLHHRTYRRLGQEHFEDLCPACRPCHDRIHTVLESNPAWLRLERGQANDLIIALLRKVTIATQTKYPR